MHYKQHKTYDFEPLWVILNLRVGFNIRPKILKYSLEHNKQNAVSTVPIPARDLYILIEPVTVL